MKSTTIALISVAAMAVGTTIGIGTTQREFAHEKGIDAVGGEGNITPRNIGPDVSSTGTPKVIVVGAADFDFGVMERDEKGEHTFQLKNVGDAPATLKKGETTCKCTMSDLDEGEIDPGETVEVTLEWTPRSFANSFRQSATIEVIGSTREMISLSIHGRVTQTVRPEPERIVLTNLSANEERQAEVYVYYYRDGEFDLQFHRFEDPALGKHFDVQIVPMAKEIVRREPDAQSGYQIVVTAKSGLPLGPIKQTLHFTSNLDDLPQLAIPVNGTVTGDISVLASKDIYNKDLRLITLGGLARATGGVFKLQLLVKGPYAKTTELSVGEVDPADVLQVDIHTDQATSINDGAVWLYPMTITIPPNSRPISRMGGRDGEGLKFGKIVIDTTHPTSPQLLLLVKFAVEGQVGR